MKFTTEAPTTTEKAIDALTADPKALARVYRYYFPDAECAPEKMLSNLLNAIIAEGGSDVSHTQDYLMLLAFFQDLFEPLRLVHSMEQDN